jgi:hypothetical protein
VRKTYHWPEPLKCPIATSGCTEYGQGEDLTRPAGTCVTVIDILTTAVDDTPQLSPTMIFNEEWMLRFTLDALSQVSALEHPLAFKPRAAWYSEALLPSAFRPRNQADALRESHTR